MKKCHIHAEVFLHITNSLFMYKTRFIQLKYTLAKEIMAVFLSVLILILLSPFEEDEELGQAKWS